MKGRTHFIPGDKLSAHSHKIFEVNSDLGSVTEHVDKDKSFEVNSGITMIPEHNSKLGDVVSCSSLVLKQESSSLIGEDDSEKYGNLRWSAEAAQVKYYFVFRITQLH